MSKYVSKDELDKMIQWISICPELPLAKALTELREMRDAVVQWAGKQPNEPQYVCDACTCPKCERLMAIATNILDAEKPASETSKEANEDG